MVEWWESLSVLVRVFYCIAIPASLILIIQTVLSLIGLAGGGSDFDSDADADTDAGGDTDLGDGADIDGTDADLADADGFVPETDVSEGIDLAQDAADLRFFSFRGFVAFFTMTGWTGVVCGSNGLPSIATVPIAIAVGLLSMFLVAKLYQLLFRLQSDGTVNIKNTIGLRGEVYIPVPASGEGQGKVSVTVQDRFSEFDAITDGAAKLGTGTYVRITDVRGGILVVEKDG